MALDPEKVWTGAGVPAFLTFIAKAGEEAVDFADAAVIVELPAVDPEVLGQLWNDAGTVKVSAGP